jgi:uncharacterized RDD family membrane protein YckC
MSDLASPFTKPPEGGSTSPVPLPPPHPLDEMWYVQGEVAALGPHRGEALKQMIEQGSINRSTQVAKVGWKEWVALGDVPAFKRFFVECEAAAEGARKAAYAGFWIRLAAYILDYVILTLVCLSALLIAGGVAFLIIRSADATIESIQTHKVPLYLGTNLLGLFYYVYFMRGPWQATPGKRLCGIHITRGDGRAITGWRALGRTFAYILSAIPLGIGFLMIGWTNQKGSSVESVGNVWLR